MHRELENDLMQQHISHAYLLVGEREAAIEDATAFAMALNCISPQDGHACGVCRSCALSKEESFCDFTRLQPEKETYSVKEIRNFVKIAQYTPQEGAYRVFLLTDIDKMAAPAMNAMLKTIEEPIADTVILLLTENYDKVLPTITSRCHVLRYAKTPPVDELALDKAYALLTTLGNRSVEAVFTESDAFSAKNKEELRALLCAAEMILSQSYEARYHPLPTAHRLLSAESYGENALFFLWEKAEKALEYLEFQVNPRLIADTFFLAVKESNGGI